MYFKKTSSRLKKSFILATDTSEKPKASSALIFYF